MKIIERKIAELKPAPKPKISPKTQEIKNPISPLPTVAPTEGQKLASFMTIHNLYKVLSGVGIINS
jgi:hypothetical protein